MVHTCGLSSLGDFLRATGREDAVRDLPAAIFWRDTMRAIDCDLDTVNATWRQQMTELHDAVDMAKYPVFTDVIIQRDKQGSQVRISAKLESVNAEGDESTDAQGGSADAADASKVAAALPERFIVRIGGISTQLSGGVDPVFRGQTQGEGDELRVEFLIPDYAVPGTRFRYQLGYTPSVDARYYYESWRRGTAPVSTSQP